MAHYAFLDDAGIVTEVIVGNDERSDDGTDLTRHWEAIYSEVRGQRCRRTSYNGRIRGKYAGIGDRYDEQLDVFLTPDHGQTETASTP